MKFQAFARFNGGFRFSSKQPHGRAIYETLRDNAGEAYNKDWTSRQQARFFAQAMVLAASQYQIERAANNRQWLKATELLGVLERDYQIVPEYGATLQERRVTGYLRSKVSRGSRQEAVEDALRTLLGDDFIRYESTATEDLETFPATFGELGVFARSGTPKKVIQLTTHVSRTGEPVTVSYTSLGGTSAPMAGEAYTFGCDSRDPNVEKVTLSAVSNGTLTATFTKAHASGTVAARPHPLLTSSKRYNRIVVSTDAANDPETRRKISDQMRRQLRGVSQWCIVHDEGTFLFGDADRAILGSTLLAPTPVQTFTSVFDSTFA